MSIQRYTINCYQYTGYIDPLKTGNLVLFKDHKAEIEALQAKLDSVMFEFLPNEMTKEQLEAWAKHQRSAGG